MQSQQECAGGTRCGVVSGTSARAYRPAIPQAEAVALVVNGAGSHFDPAIVAAVMRLYRRGDLLPSNGKHLLPMRDAVVPAAVPARR